MSNIKDYRRQIEREIALARERAAEEKWGADLELQADAAGLAAPIAADDRAGLAAAVASRQNPAPLRSSALGAVVRDRASAGTSHEIALERLADADEDDSVRLSALLLLKGEMFHNPTREEWRADLVEALRAATHADGEALRVAAFDLLASMKDRVAQEDLLAGLEQPETARIDARHALRFLSHDVHARVFDAARRHADHEDEDVTAAALRVLAGDTESVGRFRDLALDESRSHRVRKLAASALVNLDPSVVREVHDALHSGSDEPPPPTGGAGLATGTPDLSTALTPSADDSLKAHLRGLLGLGE